MLKLVNKPKDLFIYLSFHYLSLLDFVESDEFKFFDYNKKVKLYSYILDIESKLSLIRKMHKEDIDKIKFILSTNKNGQKSYIDTISNLIKNYSISKTQLERIIQTKVTCYTGEKFKRINLNNYLHERSRNHNDRLKEQNSNS